MKKTLIALFALGGVVFGETSTIYTDQTAINGQDIGYGFIISPLDSFMVYSGGNLGDVNFELESITLSCSSAGGSYATSAKIAVFERQGRDEAGYFVGLSNATTHSTGDITYDFSDSITLDTTKQYQFLFVNADTEASIFATDAINQSVFEQVATTSRFDRYNPDGDLPSGDGIIFNTSFSSWGGQNIAVVTLTGTVPEPTTATLSLLALAGLAARRRRK